MILKDFLVQRCSLWFKDTNLKANHNVTMCAYFSGLAVLYGSKILIWKQITTTIRRTLQRFSCSLWFKDTNLKANHNMITIMEREQVAVLYGSKILIWKQITTILLLYRSIFCCSLWFKDTNLKANHNDLLTCLTFCRAVLYGSKILIWKQITTIPRRKYKKLGCSLWFKDTNLKANHN